MTFRAPAGRPVAAAGASPDEVDLSTTQRRVLVALCRRYGDEGGVPGPAGDEQLAEELFVSVDALRTHLMVLFAKFGLDQAAPGPAAHSAGRAGHLRRRRLGAGPIGALLPPGSTVAGYEVERVVGSGGIGVLYRARQVRLDRPVALKVVEPEVAGDPVVRERLRREARTLAALDHPNVVPLYEAGEEGGTVFIATRWVEGTELGTLIRRDGPLEPARAARIAAQIAAALEVAHEKGLIHRDVKPSNVIVTSEDHVYLTDFGLTKRAGSASGLTMAAQMLGTIDYVAPEQIEGNEADTRGDVYGLACVLFETLIGTPPFAGETGGMAKMWAHINAEPPSAREHRADVPRGTRRRDPARPGEDARRAPLRGGLRRPGAGGRGRTAMMAWLRARPTGARAALLTGREGPTSSRGRPWSA